MLIRFTFKIPFQYFFEDTKIFYNSLLVLNLFKENPDPAVVGKCYFRRYDPQNDRLATKSQFSPINFNSIMGTDKNGDNPG